VRGVLPGQSAVENQTGVFFDGQSTSKVVEAIHDFESKENEFSPQAIREHSLQFDSTIFKSRMADFIRFALLDFKNRGLRKDVSEGQLFVDNL
jgi:hypothetical protein